MRASVPPIAVSMGEPAGIGPDIVLSAYASRAAEKLPPFIVFGSADLFQQRARRLGLSVEIAACTPKHAAAAFPDALPVADIPAEIADRPGDLDAAAAPSVVAAIEQAVVAVRSGDCRAVVTAPIHKAALYGTGFAYPGHTEFLAALCRADGVAPHPVMMLAHDDLRVVPLTVHVPLAEVPRLVTRDLIARTARIVCDDLIRRFGIAVPRLGFTGLNPHAGEDGALGAEEQTIIAPAIIALRAEGMEVEGPLSADTLFHPPHWRRYDAVIAMYHDQALIPIKALAFDSGVNVTLGLPIVRTSPDHGTALALAGTGKASATSMIAALRMAADMTASQ